MFKKLTTSIWSDPSTTGPIGATDRGEGDGSSVAASAASSASSAASAAGSTFMGLVKKASEAASQVRNTSLLNKEGDTGPHASTASKVTESAASAANQAANAAKGAASSLYGYLKASSAPSDTQDREGGNNTTSAATIFQGIATKFEAGAKTIAKEGANKASQLKKVVEQTADMDALQRKLAALESKYHADIEVDISALNFTYITPRVVAMGFPSSSASLGSKSNMNPVDAIAKHLRDKHQGKFMIWNLSEEPYDYSKFDDQVLEFKFPGYPAPPLGMLFNICQSIENWLHADPENIAAVHCLTGKGRTGTALASYLTWVGDCDNAMEALQYISQARGSYIQYFTNLMEGLKPRSSPLLLKRVIINSIPIFSTWTSRSRAENGEIVEDQSQGCCPYLQIFKNGKLIFTTTWKDQQNGGIKWARDTDGSVSFPINCLLQGDVLIRCRHLAEDGQRISMFRAAFHTGYIPLGILRLTKAQLDGACQDDRFSTEFFVDLIFAQVTSGDSSTGVQMEGLQITGAEKEAYDDMLHKDEAFWEDIAKRKALRRKKTDKLKPTVEQPGTSTTFSIISAEENINIEYERPRIGSWDAIADQELLAQLESLTTTSSIKPSFQIDAAGTTEGPEMTSKGSTTFEWQAAAPSTAIPLKAEKADAGGVKTSKEEDLIDFMGPQSKPMLSPVELNSEISALADLEKELGLESFSRSIQDLPLDTHVSDADLLGDLEGLGVLEEERKEKTEPGQLQNVDVDDNFDELEEYLSSLSTK